MATRLHASAVCLAILLCLPVAEAAQTTDKPYEACVSAAGSNDYDRVIRACPDAIAASPDKPDRAALLHSMIGIAHLHKRQYDKSAEHFTLALRSARGVDLRASIYFDRGAANYFADEPLRAVLDYGNALRLSPGKANVHFERGRAFSALGDPVRARRHFAEAMALDKNNPNYKAAHESARQAEDAQRRATPQPQISPGNTYIVMGRQSINTETEGRTLDELAKANAKRAIEILAEIKANADLFAPLMFYAVANVVYRAGDDEEALFWMLAGELRVAYDAARSADISARAAVGALAAQANPGIRRYALESAEALPAMIDRVLKFDERTGYNYDHRWINAHGMSSIVRPDAPTSLPESSWPTLRAETRDRWALKLRESIPAMLRVRDE